MKKLFALVVALGLLVSTSGLVFAQGTTASTTPVAKKTVKHVKKPMKKKPASPTTTPVAK